MKRRKLAHVTDMEAAMLDAFDRMSNKRQREYLAFLKFQVARLKTHPHETEADWTSRFILWLLRDKPGVQ